MTGEKDAPDEMPGEREAHDLASRITDAIIDLVLVDGENVSASVLHPATDIIAEIIAPILAEKERERDEAKADLAKLMDPELKHLRIEGGAIDLALTGPIVQHMGLVISEHFRASGAENYIEMTYHAKTEPFETYVWTIQKRVGSNSPHDLRAKAEARALAAEAALAAAVEALAPFADEKNGVMQDLLWGDQPDSATMTITCPLGQVRKAREAVRAAAIRAEGE